MAESGVTMLQSALWVAVALALICQDPGGWNRLLCACILGVVAGFAGAHSFDGGRTSTGGTDERKSVDSLIPSGNSFVVDEKELSVLHELGRQPPKAAKTLQPAYVMSVQPRKGLTREQQAEYHTNGFVVCKGWFNAAEIEVLLKATQTDPSVTGSYHVRKDAAGNDTKLALWWNLGDDTFSQFGRSACLVSAATQLMGGAEPYHSHTKLMLKEPRTGGAWEWHQDFGYWYHQGLLHPDGIINAMVAIDKNDEENGCLRLIARSHKLGKLDHGTFGGQGGADPKCVLATMALPGHDVVGLHMEPGDVAFMHSNTLHCSAPNASDRWRRNMITAYNTKENGPLPGSLAGQPAYNRIDVVDEAEILRVGVRHVDPAKNNILH